mgnify:FL=1
MSDNNNHPLGEAPWFHVILSTGLGTGFTPVAPGTAGALLALAIWYVLFLTVSPVALFVTTLVLIVVTTFFGVWTSNVMERYWGADPRTVVIDEFVGTWIPLLVAPCGKYTWITALVAFGAFRLIDIFKPLGCRKVDQIPGGWGVMLDDVLAGIYALVITYSVCELITWLAY